MKASLGYRLSIFGLTMLFYPQVALAEAASCIEESNGGGEHRAAHELLAARIDYLKCVSQPGCPAIVNKECTDALELLRTSIPTLLVSVVDNDGHDISGALLTLDGQHIRLDGAPVETDPGPHQLAATYGELSTTLDVVALESDQNRRVVLKLAPQSPSVPAPRVTDTRSSLGARPPGPLTKSSRTPGYISGSSAVIGLASFAYFGFSGRAGLVKLDECRPRCAIDDVHKVQRELVAADASLGASIIAEALATYFFTSSSPKTETPIVSKSLWLQSAGGSVQVGLTWSQ